MYWRFSITYARSKTRGSSPFTTLRKLYGVQPLLSAPSTSSARRDVEPFVIEMSSTSNPRPVTPGSPTYLNRSVIVLPAYAERSFVSVIHVGSATSDAPLPNAWSSGAPDVPVYSPRLSHVWPPSRDACRNA